MLSSCSSLYPYFSLLARSRVLVLPSRSHFSRPLSPLTATLLLDSRGTGSLGRQLSFELCLGWNQRNLPVLCTYMVNKGIIAFEEPQLWCFTTSSTTMMVCTFPIGTCKKIDDIYIVRGIQLQSDDDQSYVKEMDSKSIFIDATDSINADLIRFCC